MSLLAAALMACGALAAPAPRNLVTVGACEPLSTQPADDTNPPGWGRWQDPGASAEYIWDASAGRPGGTVRVTQYALRIENGGQRAGWVTSEPIPVSDRRMYLLAGFVSA